MDSSKENAFNLHISEKHIIQFVRVDQGLYIFDTSKIDIHKLRQAFSFLTTVDQNKKYFRRQEITKADDAVFLNRKINHPAVDKFIRLVKENWIRNNPITTGDVRRSHAIYGPPLPPIKGRTRYQESKRVKDIDIVQIPKVLFEDLKYVTLCIDFLFVNGVTVFHTISRTINYRTVSFPLSRSKTVILDQLKQIYQIYNSRGFKITNIHADIEFNKIREDIRPVRLHTCGVDDHVPEIERSIQTQKNENRSVCHAMPYKCIPRIMVRELILQGNEFLNAFGSNDTLGDGLSARNIINNLPHVDYNDLKYDFGQYVQLHVTEKVTNTMLSRTIGEIVLSPRQIQGQYNFMSLETGAKIDGRVVAILPLIPEVVNRVDKLGLDHEQPFRVSKMLKYEWRPGVAIENKDAAIEAQDIANNEIILIDPPPIAQEIPEAGPNPLAISPPPIPPSAQGAESTQLPSEDQGANSTKPVGQAHNDPAVIDNTQGDDQGAGIIGENEGAQQGNIKE